MTQSDSSNDKARKFLPPLAELIDRLTVDQIKEVLLSENKEGYAQEMQLLMHDIDLIIGEKKITISARFLRIVIVLAQMNLHIWHMKDKMQVEPERYNGLLKLSHQLNGIRNQMRNLLLEESGDKEKGHVRSNFDTDGLKGWDVSL